MAYQQLLSPSQQYSLAGIFMISATLSIVGSWSMVRSILRCRDKGPYERLVLGLSISDILFSATMVVQPWLTPSGSWDFSIGNNATCTFTGTMFQLCMSGLFYSGMLSIYFLLNVRFSCSRSWLEPCMHVLSIGWPLVTAATGAFSGWYGSLELYQGCWVSYKLERCESFTCSRTLISWLFAGIWFLLFAVLLATNSVIIYMYLGRRDHSPSGSREQSSAAQRRHLRQRADQASLFAGAFLLCYTWFFALQLMEWCEIQLSRQDDSWLYPLLVLQALFFPLTGTLNGFVYFRPRFLAVRSSYPLESRTWALRRMYHGSTVRPTTPAGTSQKKTRCSGRTDPSAPLSSLNQKTLEIHPSQISMYDEELCADESNLPVAPFDEG